MLKSPEMRKAGGTVLNLTKLVLAVGAVVVPLAYGVQMSVSKGYPSQVAVFSHIMITPFMFVFPLLAAFLGGLRMYSEVGHRFASLMATRQSMYRYLAGRLVGSAIVPFACFFL